MKKISLVIFIFLFSISVYSQNRNNIWCFGDSCLINFNTQPPTTGSSIIRTRGTACSISDNAGNLLFYCGDPHIDLWLAGGNNYFYGVVYNKNNEIMENGDTLAGEGWYNEMIIVPNPLDLNKYYLFQIEEGLQNPGLYFSLIDLSYNGGLGKVTSKNNQLMSGTMAIGISAVKNGNGRDWWVIARKSEASNGGPPNNEFYVYSITPSGVDSLPVQSIGSLNSTNGTSIKFNPTGEKFVFTNWKGMIEEYDFDRCSGIISNPVTIEPELGGIAPLTWSAEYSSSGQFLYVSTSSDTSFLYQFDTYATNIFNTRKIINRFGLFPYVGGELKRGPDGKIYFATAWYDGSSFNFPYPDSVYNMYNMNLGVINNPDLPDTACNFQPFSFYLGGKRNYYGLPNNPDYDLGPLVGSVCDTLHLSVNEIAEDKTGLNIFPNPSNGIINFSTDEKQPCELRIINTIGEIIMTKQFAGGRATIQDLNAGIYFAQLMQGGRLLNVQKFIIIK